jgi:hypothetical protein
MPLDIAHEVTALRQMTVGQLRQRFAELFGEATAARNKTWLIKRLAWRLQALAAGDLSERARRRAAELANDADLRLHPPRGKTSPPPPEPIPVPAPPDQRLPPPGTILTRHYKGQQLHMQVLADGFAFAGTVYRSLSAVAKAITGSHCNGYHFFRAALNRPKESR